jgi:hypothetical protein
MFFIKHGLLNVPSNRRFSSRLTITIFFKEDTAIQAKESSSLDITSPLFMKRLIAVFSAILIAFISNAQPVTGKLSLQQGQNLEVTMAVKTTISQQAMGQAIDFNVDGTATHNYKVTNSTGDNSTLHHSAKRVVFNFEGMGTKRPFDSENPKDMAGMFGAPIKQMLGQTFDMVIDTNGKVLMVQPEKQKALDMDDRMKIVANMLRDILTVVQPPVKGGRSFFAVMPGGEVVKNGTWIESFQDSTGSYQTGYKLTDITDSTLIVDVNGVSKTSSKAEMMGMEISTSFNNKITGTIILDRATGIIRKKVITTEGSGTSTGFGGATPISSKTTVTTLVKSE